MKRAIATSALLLITLTSGAAAQEDFDPTIFIGQGDAYNCGDFNSQARAQAVLRADPTDPNRLDADWDGIACESNRGAQDRDPVLDHVR